MIVAHKNTLSVVQKRLLF